MSYNIDTCKIKRLNNLTVPLSAFYKSDRVDWHPKKPTLVDVDNMIVELSCGCGLSITGVLNNGILNITELALNGEGSGSFMRYVFEPAMKESSGELEAVMVWEGGDSITRFLVNNGEVSEEDVKL